MGFVLLLSLGTANLTVKRRLPPKHVAGGLLNPVAFKNPAYTIYCLAGIISFLGLYTGRRDKIWLGTGSHLFVFSSDLHRRKRDYRWHFSELFVLPHFHVQRGLWRRSVDRWDSHG
jgi:hypothetical protein